MFVIFSCKKNLDELVIYSEKVYLFVTVEWNDGWRNAR